MYEGEMDLTALAGAYAPTPLASSTVKYEDHRTPSSSRRPPPKGHPTLADFTKQRQQMAQLEEQFAIPSLDELKRPYPPGAGARGMSDGYEDHFDPSDQDPWNLSPDQEFHDDILEEGEQGFGRGGHEEYDARLFSEIQSAREKEFLELFCERLSGYPEEIAVSIIDELADRLHHKVCLSLSQLTSPHLSYLYSSPLISSPWDTSLIPTNTTTTSSTICSQKTSRLTSKMPAT
jgi:hypothetical protein